MRTGRRCSLGVLILCGAVGTSPASWAKSPVEEEEQIRNIPPQLRAVVEAETVLPRGTLVTIPETVEGEPFSFMLEEPVWAVSESRMERYHTCAEDARHWKGQAIDVATTCAALSEERKVTKIKNYAVAVTVSAIVFLLAGYAMGKEG